MISKYFFLSLCLFFSVCFPTHTFSTLLVHLAPKIIVCNSPLVHGFLLVVNKVGDQVVEAWFDEIIIVGLISSEAATEARAL